jgi:hypothetical protein
MKKRLGLIAACMAAALACAALLAGCGGKPVPHTELVSHLGSLKGSAGGSPDAPYTVKIASVNIKAAWAAINKAVYTAGKYVILDLSACSAPENTIDDDIGEVIQGNEYIKGIILPDSLTSIGERAFFGCANLTSITIPASVTDIATNSFFYCANLNTITVKSANAAFASEDGALFNKDKTTLLMYPSGKGTSYSIPNKVANIGDSAFLGRSSLASVTIPDSVASIGDNAFSGCTGLTNLTIPDSVASIGDNVFSGCTGLTSITISTSVTSIGERSFWGCTGLTNITIPNTVAIIGNSAFSGCTGLTSITIPNMVTIIGDSAFSGCTGLTSITISTSVTSIGERSFWGCAGLTSITIPNNVTSIDESAFEECDGLTSVTFENDKTQLVAWDSSIFASKSFPGDLGDKYRAGGAGTYTSQAVRLRSYDAFGYYRYYDDLTWTKQ